MSKNLRLMLHGLVGFPNQKNSLQLLALLASYADILEVQLPFSDPVADGATIMRANDQALATDPSLHESLKIIKSLAQKTQTQLLLMTYMNIVLATGVKHFCKLAKTNGVSLLLVPDLPFDTPEFKQLSATAKTYRIGLVYVVSPNIKPARLQFIKNQDISLL